MENRHFFRIFMQLLIIAFSLSIFFTSCSKETGDLPKVTTFDGMLRFATVEDFQNTITALSLMKDDDERAKWENNNNFLSYDRASKELYYSFNPNKFKDFEDVKNFVKQNSKYLQLIQDGEDYILDTYFMPISLKYISNADALYMIDNYVYKVLEEGVVSTKYENINYLKTIEYYNLNSWGEDYCFESYFQEYNNFLKDAGYNCGLERIERGDDGNQRVYMRVSLYLNDDKNGTTSTMVCEYLVRPYNRVLGIWYWCQRDLLGNINVAIDLKQFGLPWERGFYNDLIVRNNTYSAEGILKQISILNNSEIHFGGLKCTARFTYDKKTPNIPYDQFSCNPSLF